MGLQMITGASGTGKSEYIYKTIDQMAKINRDKRYFVIVPDQFTMQTQADMVKIAGGGIMNIDVLSFLRLAHRIFEETNCENRLVLDDTGKSLVLRRLASDIKEKLPYLSSNLKRSGFIHEVKSSICEFMQYRIGPEELDKLIKFSESKGALKAKLKDLRVLYADFLDYIKDSYITTEESMDLLASKLEESKLIKNSVVVFDGFTGFTPVQMRVVTALMKLCDTVYITLTLEKNANGKDGLFALTHKTYETLFRAAKENDIEIHKDIICERNHRFANKPSLLHLERNLFRYPFDTYQGDPKELALYEASDTEDEVRHLAMNIRELLFNGAQYREMAVITGNIESYENHIIRTFEDFDIPVYIDKTRAIVLNPFVEYTKSLLKMIQKNFDRDSVIRFLRSGIAGFDQNDTDIFENFCIKTGLKGKKRYESYIAADDIELAKRINTIRENLMESIDPVLSADIRPSGKLRANVYVRALYECYEKNDLYSRLKLFEDSFRDMGDFTKEKEYAQIYRLTMELLEQICGLLGEEEITLEEFYDILEAGFEEISVGTIPQGVDKVIVGDMERSRLKPVKYLFFLGLNDGYVPRKNSKCSILSDMEREYLAGNDMDLELAPTPRQQIFIQRFYMYSNLVKPSDRLYMSYSSVDNEGRSMRCAYIIPVIRKIFPKLEVKHPDLNGGLKDIGNEAYLKEYVCSKLREYADHDLNEKDLDQLMQAISLMLSLGDTATRSLLEMFINNSFYRYRDESIDAKIAGILYGERLLASISRMEQFAGCAYSYFLRYGLTLKERETYDIDNRDLGSIFHEVLEKYGNSVADLGLSWTDMTPERTEEIISRALEESVIKSGSILFENEANRYIYKKMSKVLNKAIDVLTYQLKAGQYKVSALEIPFKRIDTLDEINVALDKQEKMELNGRIDRIDTLESDDAVYVKVIDYKTGNRDFSLLNFYYGLQLQLVVYMSEGMKESAKRFKDRQILPGALLYYRVADNTVDADNETDEDKINSMIKDSLKTKGLINDDPVNVFGITGIKDGKSDVVNLGFNKNGSYSSSSSVMNVENMRLLSDYAQFKLRQIGNDIISGKITKNPIKEDERKNSCTYCAYKKVCGFDKRLDGYEMKQLKKTDDDELLAKMRQDMEAEING